MRQGRLDAATLASFNACLPHVHDPQTGARVPVIVVDLVGMDVTGPNDATVRYRCVVASQDSATGVTFCEVTGDDLCVPGMGDAPVEPDITTE